MDLAEYSYWDQYDGNVDYFASRALPSQDYAASETMYSFNMRTTQHRSVTLLSAVSTEASSRDSYWSRHLGSTRGTATGPRTPASRNELAESPAAVSRNAAADTQTQRRLFVMPGRLEALRLGSSADEHEKQPMPVREKQAVPPSAGVAVTKNITQQSGSSSVPVSVDGETCALEHHQHTCGTATSLNAEVNVQDADTLHAKNTETTHLQQKKKQDMDVSSVNQSLKGLGDGAQAITDSGSSIVAAADKAVAVVSAAADVAPVDSPLGSSYQGVNPAALITRLNFLKEQMEQDERLFLNTVV
ncbi:hypothetical protein H4217_006751 [Coemansia sp. RSA 1939]|nr:hypothetical protein H4217_006751 [Coemansia sp. RSA 1939]KAJ2611712.1 hypothetical protein EV177_003347 [Coemansia sp. RSA 1804]